MQFSRSYLLRRPKSSSGKRRLAIIMAAAMLLALAVFLAVHVISTFNMFHNRAEWAQALRLQGAAGEVNYLVYGVDYWGASPYVERLVLILHHQDRETVNLVYIPGNTLIEGADGEAAPLGRLYRRLGNPAFIELVQDLSGFPVNHYLELHYAGIGVVADYLGGIDASGLPRGAGGAPARGLAPAGRADGAAGPVAVAPFTQPGGAVRGYGSCLARMGHTKGAVLRIHLFPNEHNNPAGR